LPSLDCGASIHADACNVEGIAACMCLQVMLMCEQQVG